MPYAVIRPCALTEEPAGAELLFEQGDNITVITYEGEGGGRVEVHPLESVAASHLSRAYLDCYIDDLSAIYLVFAGRVFATRAAQLLSGTMISDRVLLFMSSSVLRNSVCADLGTFRVHRQELRFAKLLKGAPRRKVCF